MKQTSKIKTLRISEETHTELLKYCKDRQLKMNEYASQLLLKTIRSLYETELKSKKQ